MFIKLYQKIIVLIDSNNATTVIKNSELNNEIITQIFEIHEKIIGKGNTIKLIWIHVEITGNEKSRSSS